MRIDLVRQFARIREMEGYETMGKRTELTDAVWNAFQEKPRVDDYLTFLGISNISMVEFVKRVISKGGVFKTRNDEIAKWRITI